MLASLSLPIPAVSGPRAAASSTAARTAARSELADSAERALFERLRDGDREALGELYRRHSRAVYAAAIGVLRARQEAEEILQDTFVTMWHRRGAISLVGESTLPWLVTTSRFLALNRARSISRRRTDSVNDPDAIESRRRSPDDEAALSELRARLESAIAGLPELDRSIVALCLSEDYTYKEAAVRLGVSQATVRNRLGRLRVRLRAALGSAREGER
ncbi:sigma-70 family RNA polymerase sigma factor [Galbitalea sp. SE-J8]|uniref:RNA polymerase sigma factor n=1 Tax=Galbitalea sp. SE-J8 TaxID=3054952 RepID=UPI00259C8353|nr:sigma-70 family RNA polymerase sigma factor [Galbitalea sp. SE-J8]MDM4762185.1 sigma-70 family RNA polymerase sigma factor [Galbitalea sp. SE-J8]